MRALSALLLAAPLLISCSQKDPAKCDEALAATRQSLASGQEDLMGQWRARAYKYCEAADALAGLDREISDAQKQAQAKAQAEAQATQKKAQLVQMFTDWVGSGRADARKAAAPPTCEEPAKGAKKDERFCSATRQAGPYTLSTRYWEAEPAAARFSVQPGFALSCDDFSGTQPISTMTVPTVSGVGAKRNVCQFTGGALSGMQLVVTDAQNATVHIYSGDYLLKDPAMKKFIGN